MKFLIALIIIIPTLIAVLLFTVVTLAYNNPAMLAAATNPTIAILCIISGVIAALPLLVAIIFGLANLITSTKKKKEQDDKD